MFSLNIRAKSLILFQACPDSDENVQFVAKVFPFPRDVSRQRVVVVGQNGLSGNLSVVVLTYLNCTNYADLIFRAYFFKKTLTSKFQTQFAISSDWVRFFLVSDFNNLR